MHYDKAVKKLPAEAGTHFDRGAALYALSRFDEAGRGVPARDRGQGPGAQGVGLLQPGQRLLQEGEVQGGGVGLHAIARPQARRQAGQVEPGDRAAQAEGQGRQGQEGPGQEGQGQEEGRQEQGHKTRRTRRKTTRRTIRRRIRTRRTRRTSRTRRPEGQAETRSRRRSRARRRSRSRSSRCSTTSNAAPRTWRRSGPRPGPCGARRRSVTGEAARVWRIWRAARSARACAGHGRRPRAAQAATVHRRDRSRRRGAGRAVHLPDHAEHRRRRRRELSAAGLSRVSGPAGARPQQVDQRAVRVRQQPAVGSVDLRLDLPAGAARRARRGRSPSARRTCGSAGAIWRRTACGCASAPRAASRRRAARPRSIPTASSSASSPGPRGSGPVAIGRRPARSRRRRRRRSSASSPTRRAPSSASR